MKRLATAVPKPRRKPPKARAKLKRGRVKRSNPTRKAKNWTRAYGSPERVAFVAGLPCIVGLLCHYAHPRENAHIGTGGMGRKSDADQIVPLCRTHHAALHRLGRGWFEQSFSVNLASHAATTEAFWQSHLASSPQQDA